MTQIDQLNGVIAFLHSAEALSFTAAAAKLGITKSAVGKSVTKLEERLGIKLLHRSTRRLSLTPDGEAYYASVRHALGEIAAAETTLLSKSQVISGRLRIDAPAAFGRQILMPLLLDFSRAYTGLTLSLSFNDKIVDPVEEGVDLTIRFGETRDCTGLISKKLTEQPSVVVASSSYLAARGTPQSVADLQQHDCICGFGGNSASWRIKGSDGAAVRYLPPVSHQFGDGEAIVQAALAGLGLCQMPRSLVRAHLEKGTLTSVLEQVADVPVSVYAVWPVTRHLLPRVRTVVDFLAEKGRQGALD
ncbi:LysR family transcriptional regulator [Rhizobium ruizarguesonis]|jgi:DNA-binding transcriptional LysR family regulator|uniref:LysR family transcriptional regulator n=1 Tax=Rhizobium ruizarguesonis TaxID=2081791 RepID=UPI0010323550|nr:LysR family transcriptional regulator [Rhizobium ruizarguesonis]NEH75754.1 LysR family transcriptional regulator [Rhizobium ruizarguesonis]NEJ85580.1 LysR family transcriptional regulator [Rhizobium ruizarguesonis]TAT73535.1 LysR family transcriptional regulator [Rhizobium ruizarguesonis]TAT74572.1 LysR family transcriptional regulator [Rhizobium ruizarguesonis]TAU35569.1 LysR family transcriptional regulator [Rhizobium ruizarguesonis]